jgi:hypothetical protein
MALLIMLVLRKKHPLELEQTLKRDFALLAGKLSLLSDSLFWLSSVGIPKLPDRLPTKPFHPCTE